MSSKTVASPGVTKTLSVLRTLMPTSVSRQSLDTPEWLVLGKRGAEIEWRLWADLVGGRVAV